MAWEDAAERAARVQLERMGRPSTYTRKGETEPLPDQVLVHLIRNVERDRQGLDVVVVQRLTEALVLRSEVGKPRRGDTFEREDGTGETWWVDDVIRDDGFVVRVAVKPESEATGNG